MAAVRTISQDETKGMSVKVNKGLYKREGFTRRQAYESMGGPLVQVMLNVCKGSRMPF
jgi:hypothetical protein